MDCLWIHYLQIHARELFEAVPACLRGGGTGLPPASSGDWASWIHRPWGCLWILAWAETEEVTKVKTLTKKFRAIIHNGLPREGWNEEQGGETLLPDDAVSFEADTLSGLGAAMAVAGVTVPEAPTESERPTYTQRDYEWAIKDRLDREAQAAPYLWDSIDRAVSFTESTVAKYRAEAKYFIALRDACWILCFEALANPPEIPPTPAEFADSIVTKAFAQVSNKNN